MDIRNRRILVPVGAEIVKGKQMNTPETMILPETEIWIVSVNIIQVVDVAGNGNMVRIGKYYRK